MVLRKELKIVITQVKLIIALMDVIQLVTQYQDLIALESKTIIKTVLSMLYAEITSSNQLNDVKLETQIVLHV